MKTLEQEVDEIVRRLLMKGWELGKKQVKTPYKYTLGDDSIGKKEYDELIKLIEEERGY